MARAIARNMSAALCLLILILRILKLPSGLSSIMSRTADGLEKFFARCALYSFRSIMLAGQLSAGVFFLCTTPPHVVLMSDQCEQIKKRLGILRSGIELLNQNRRSGWNLKDKADGTNVP